jgi:holo-[acyl-carrier protein] synthase
MTGNRLRIGIDVVDIARFRSFVGRTSGEQLGTLFSERELANAASRGDIVPGLAARFAGKEAVMKALEHVDAFSLDWRDIEVFHTGGTPRVELHRAMGELARELGISEIAISLSHGKQVAVAQVVALRESAAPS